MQYSATGNLTYFHTLLAGIIRIRSTATASLSYQIHYRIHIHGSCR